MCSSILNSTFQRLQNQMLHRFQAIKAKMPRRESARRSHPLACESDIIETLHMRLSLLQMTFGKHIERKHCCFFPGEVSSYSLSQTISFLFVILVLFIYGLLMCITINYTNNINCPKSPHLVIYAIYKTFS